MASQCCVLSRGNGDDNVDFIALTHIPGQNGRYFSDDIFKCIFVYEKSCVLIKISLKFNTKGPIDKNLALI